jgi:hypothetical protein
MHFFYLPIHAIVAFGVCRRPQAVAAHCFAISRFESLWYVSAPFVPLFFYFLTLHRPVLLI